jgi:DNA-binding HxlR family transcriptional regulator
LIRIGTEEDAMRAQAPGPAATTATPPSTICPRFHHAVELIGRRWTGAILQGLLDGATRFSELAAAVPGLSDRLLSERLRELEAEGIVGRAVIPAVPVRVEYRLTAKGRALAPVLAAITAWAQEWIPLPDAASGSPADVRDDLVTRS